MKNLLKITTTLIVLTVVSGSLISCTNTASSETGTFSNTNSAASKNSVYPPVLSSLMQAEIKDLDGSTFKLEDKKGKIILVNLWATWCGPCREEMPELIALQEKYGSKDFEVIGLDSDDEETPEMVKAFAEKMKLNYQLGYADARMMNDFLKVSKFNGIPQTFLIDREGRLRNVFGGGGAKNVSLIKEAVEKVFNE